MEKVGLILVGVGVVVLVLIIVMIAKGEFNEGTTGYSTGWSESRTSTTRSPVGY